MNSSQRMGTEKISKLLLNLSLPAMTAMLVMALYNIVDTIFVGQGVGITAIGGIAIVLPVQMAILAIGMTFGIGGASIISRALGANDKKSAAYTLGNTTGIALAIGIIIMLLGLLFQTPLMRLFGAKSKELLSFSTQYFSTVVIGIPFFTFSIAANNAARAEGRAKIAMFTMLIGALINLILDPIFIFGFKMGVQGAALATVISQICSALFLFFYFQSGRSQIHFHFSYFRPNKKILKETVAIGASSFSRQIASTVMIAILNNSLATYGGDSAVSVFGIIFRLTSFILMPTFGIAQGMQPIVGYNYGAKKFHRVKKSFRLSCIYATILSSFGTILFLLFPEAMLKIFIPQKTLIESPNLLHTGIQLILRPGELLGNQQIIQIGKEALRIVTFLYPLVGFQVVGATMFMALGKAWQAFILSITRQVLLLIPLVVILPPTMGLQGIWVAFPISEFLAALITLIMVYQLLSTQGKKQHTTKNRE